MTDGGEVLTETTTGQYEKNKLPCRQILEGFIKKTVKKINISEGLNSVCRKTA